MNELYQGKLSCENVPAAKEELTQIKKALSKLSPNKVIWDIDDLSKVEKLSEVQTQMKEAQEKTKQTIKEMKEYGKTMGVLALNAAIEIKKDVMIQ